MYSKALNNNNNNKKTLLENNKDNSNCIVSKASTEIMLDRFTDGKEIDFPFTKWFRYRWFFSEKYILILIWLFILKFYF